MHTHSQTQGTISPVVKDKFYQVLETLQIYVANLKTWTVNSSSPSQLWSIHVKQVSLYSKKENVTSRVNKVESDNMYILSIWCPIVHFLALG